MLEWMVVKVILILLWFVIKVIDVQVPLPPELHTFQCDLLDPLFQGGTHLTSFFPHPSPSGCQGVHLGEPWGYWQPEGVMKGEEEERRGEQGVGGEGGGEGGEGGGVGEVGVGRGQKRERRGMRRREGEEG